jgi:hypothetical protein
VNGVGVAVGGDGQQLVAVEECRHGAAVQQLRLVGLHPDGALVHVGVDGYGADAQFVASANDAASPRLAMRSLRKRG